MPLFFLFIWKQSISNVCVQMDIAPTVRFSSIERCCQSQGAPKPGVPLTNTFLDIHC